jgi:hypothetical protein
MPGLFFPYDLRETFEAFLKQEKDKNKAKQKLLKIGFKKWEVDLIKNHNP